MKVKFLMLGDISCQRKITSTNRIPKQDIDDYIFIASFCSVITRLYCRFTVFAP